MWQIIIMSKNSLVIKISSLSLKYKISIAIASLVALLLFAACTMINISSRAETKSANEIIIRASFDDVHQSISMFIQGVWNELSTIHLDNIQDSRLLAERVTGLLNHKGEPMFEALFTLDPNGKVVASSNPELLGQDFSTTDIYLAAKTGSHFEMQVEGDEVFDFFSLNRDGFTLVAKLNNERISILAQSARPYPASSDNYLFTLKDSKIGPAATAISRSAFEGDLIKGIAISKGTVQVKKNTELELKFLDPETGKPTLGVQSVIDSGKISNMEGYPDYRHVPVVGIGGTIKFADDFTVGLLSEADLNVIGVGIHGRDERLLQFLLVMSAVLLLLCAVAGFFIAKYVTKRIDKIKEFTAHADDLNFRLAAQDNDELGALTEGVNKFLQDRQVAAENIEAASREMKALLDESVKFKNMIENMPTNIITADKDCLIDSVNPASMSTLRSLEHLLPIKADEAMGKSFEIFHRQASLEKSKISNPANLPHRTVIDVGGEKLDLLVSPLYDSENNYIGPMLTWEVVTEKLKLKEREDRIKTELESTIKTLAESSRELDLNSEGLSTGMTQIGSIVDEVQSYINSVNVAAEEMISSIGEISSNTDKAASMTREAVSQIEGTETVIKNLQKSSEEITSILKVVTEIASQTNLLALNATIEAARAGEAGKGFAVVANEVKELANRTAEATEDIGRKITVIQKESQEALESIATATSSVKSVNEVTVTIASAVEEQTAVTAEIGRSMKNSTEKVSEMTNSIDKIGNFVTNNVEKSGDVNSVTDKLQNLALAT